MGTAVGTMRASSSGGLGIGCMLKGLLIAGAIIFGFSMIMSLGELDVYALESNWTLEDVSDAEAIQLQQVVVDEYSHEYDPDKAKHPEAPQVRKCFEEKGAYRQFKISKVRFLRVCIMPDGQFGFQIVEEIKGVMRELTAYIKEGIRTPGQLQDWAFRRGYPRFKGWIG